MDEVRAQTLIELLRNFVEPCDELRGLGVVGSWARGNPRPGSDLDLIVLARDPTRWRRRQSWLRTLQFSQCGLAYCGHRTATYGAVWSAHIDHTPVARLELTLAAESWAGIDPIDSGTRRVVDDDG